MPIKNDVVTVQSASRVKADGDTAGLDEQPNETPIVTDEQSSLGATASSDTSTIDDVSMQQRPLSQSSSNTTPPGLKNSKKRLEKIEGRDVNLEGPGSFVGKRVAKYFVDGEKNKQRLFFGTIDKVKGPKSSKPLWHVTYDDDDEEDFDANDLSNALTLHSQHKGKDYVGRRVAKYVKVDDKGDQLFFGTIKKVALVTPERTFWNVEYDDGDEENYGVRDVKAATKLHFNHKRKDPKATVARQE
jgi:hypothetical protein